MTYAEIVVNVPIRRTFARRFAEGPPLSDEDGPPGAVEPQAEDAPSLQAFHYSLPPQLEGVVQPGHLVWAPFGAREVQGFVLRLSDSAPVETREVLRLARPEPVLTPVQLELAAWMAEYYIAAPAETLKLFLPPGLLEKAGTGTGVRAKRELELEWIGPDDEEEAYLQRLARSTPGSAVLAYMLAHEGERPALKVVQAACALKSAQPVKTLVDKGVLALDDDKRVGLALSVVEAQETLAALQGVDRYRPAIAALRQAGGPVWKSDLPAADAPLALLRDLEGAGLVRMSERTRFRDPLAGRSYARTTAPRLTDEQRAVWRVIREQGFGDDSQNARSGARPHFLIHGVTGSGKTEIYLHAIAETLGQGRQAIVLVPEIALTPQTVARFAGRFAGRVTVIHSGLSSGERYDVWRKVREGEFDVVVGPRSALFAPLPRLGLIVIDEEHEPSYKQNAEEWGSHTVFYDARRVAARLADLSDSVLILGSATPSLEAYWSAQRSRITLLEMPRRLVGHGAQDGTAYAEMPPVEIVDMRQELRAGNRSVFSRSLQAELHATLDAGEQAILFLNRRGTNTFVMCRDCGATARCTRCDTPLTYHERAETLLCHHCNRRYPIPTVCSECGSKRIKYFGTGTQRIEELIGEIAPRARLMRWDADATTGKGSHEEILERFTAHEADVLVGTQMIAKGLDLPLVTLVGVIAADVGLYLPDFRSGERTFQLLTQVAGRAGRSRRGGRVVIQTYSPEHYVIQAAAEHHYTAFYRREMEYRRELGYPPLQRMARLIYWDKNAQKAEAMAEQMGRQVHERIAALGLRPESVTVVGPAPAYFARYRGYYRWQIVLSGADPAAIVRGLTIPFGWRVDVDPVSVL